MSLDCVPFPLFNAGASTLARPDPLLDFCDAFRWLAADALAGRTAERLIVATATLSGRLVTWVEIDGEQVKTVLSHSEQLAALSHPSAKILIMAHNHPSGDASPSRFDIMATRRIAKFSSAAGLHLVDHLIFAGDSFYSFSGAGLL